MAFDIADPDIGLDMAELLAGKVVVVVDQEPFPSVVVVVVVVPSVDEAGTYLVDKFVLVVDKRTRRLLVVASL